VTAAGLDKLGR